MVGFRGCFDLRICLVIALVWSVVLVGFIGWLLAVCLVVVLLLSSSDLFAWKMRCCLFWVWCCLLVVLWFVRCVLLVVTGVLIVWIW